jgi:hypothetical protein
MLYEAAFLECLAAGDYAGALSLALETVSRGKPKPPKGAVRALVMGFGPRHGPEMHADGLCRTIERAQQGAPELWHRFNALVFRIHHVDRTVTFLDPANWDEKAETLDPLYWPPGSVNFTFPEDWKDDIQFATGLAKRSQYRFIYRQEEVPGAMLHFHLRVAILCQWLQEVVDRLSASPQWEKISRATPFQFFVASVPRPDAPSPFFLELTGTVCGEK